MLWDLPGSSMHVLSKTKKLSHMNALMFLKLRSGEPQGSTKVYQGFREMKMHNVGRILLTAQNLYLLIKINMATFDTNQSVTDSIQTIDRCFSPEASPFCSPVSQLISP
jgi:hypothetical protein